MNRYVAALLVVLGVVGLVGVLAGGAGYAEDNGDENGDENASRAKCSKATLEGTYLLAVDGVDITGNKQVPVWAANLREKTSVEELGLRSRQLLSNLGCVSVRANGQLALEFFEVCLPSARAVPFVVYEAIEPFSDR